MLLKEIYLKNIRSYKEQKIVFPEGSTLLSGDIGCGKSSILLAIEFALFGSSRNELPAELLLRKGSSSGSVSLNFQLGDKNIVIERNLKKEKDNIKQISGSLTVNNLKKELMPLELKSEIVSMLGYPEEIISKNKNYIFRYTVYTPQEEMKQILHEDPEIRLDTLRKIFNIDKYKTIRENLQHNLRLLRMKMTVLKTKTENLSVLREKEHDLSEEQKSLSGKGQEAKDSLQKIRINLGAAKEEFHLLQKKQQEFLDLKQQQELVRASLTEKEKHLLRLSEDINRIELEILTVGLPEEVNKEHFSGQLKELEQKKNQHFQKKTFIEQNILQKQLKIKEVKKETQELRAQIAQKENILIMLKELDNDLNLSSDIEQQKEMAEIEFQEIIRSIAKANTIHEHENSILLKINSLDDCPLCLQKVSSEHKAKINQQAKEKIDFSQKRLYDLKDRQTKIMAEIKRLRLSQQQRLEKQTKSKTLRLEIIHLEEKEQLLQQKDKQMISMAEENELLMQQLSELSKEDYLSWQKKIEDIQAIISLLIKREHLYENLHRSIQQRQKLSSEIEQQNILLQKIIQNISLSEDFTGPIKEKQDQLDYWIEKEQSAVIILAQLETRLENNLKLKKELDLEIEMLSKKENLLIRYQEIYHWLESYFLNLTYTIEKQVMVVIYNLFNQLFQEWFSMLIDDENITARIDDSFSPVIEQNGYEISFLNLSGGEKTSAALAYRLALNRVINDVIHQINTKDLLILDEPTDGFSSEQLDKVRDVLERLQLRQTILVSHESKIESFVENMIKIEKHGHESSVN